MAKQSGSVVKDKWVAGLTGQVLACAVLGRGDAVRVGAPGSADTRDGAAPELPPGSRIRRFAVNDLEHACTPCDVGVAELVPEGSSTSCDSGESASQAGSRSNG